MTDSRETPKVVALANVRVVPRHSKEEANEEHSSSRKEEPKEGLLSLLASGFEEGAAIVESLTGKDGTKLREAAKEMRKAHLAGVKAQVIKERIEQSKLPKIAKAMAEKLKEKGVITSREYGK